MKKLSLLIGLLIVAGSQASAMAQDGGASDFISKISIQQVVKMQVATRGLSVWLAIGNANRPDVQLAEATFDVAIDDIGANKRLELGTAKVAKAILCGVDPILGCTPEMHQRCPGSGAPGCTMIQIDIDMPQGCANLGALFNVLGEPNKSLDFQAKISGYFGARSDKGFVEQPARAMLTFKSRTGSAIFF